MRVNATITNQSTSATRSETWFTNSSGVIRVCGAANETYSAVATTDNGTLIDVEPTATSAPITGSFADCSAGTASSSNDVVFATEETHVWYMMDVIRYSSDSQFGREPGALTVRIEQLPNGVEGRYLDGSKTIIIDPSNLNQPALSRRDWAILSHEYGHALQDSELGGLDSYGAACGLKTETSLTCAYQEGFAEFHAAVTVGASGAEILFGDFIEDTYDAGSADGAEVAIPVSAMLYDLWDSNNEGSHDNTSYPASYIGNVMRTCSVGGSSVDGVDMLIYCLEDRMTAESTFEPIRDFSSSASQSSSASKPSGWSANAIRSVWTENLAPPFLRAGSNQTGGDPPCPLLDPNCEEPCEEGEGGEDGCCEEGEGPGGDDCIANEFDLDGGHAIGPRDTVRVLPADVTRVARQSRILIDELARR